MATVIQSLARGHLARGSIHLYKLRVAFDSAQEIALHQAAMDVTAEFEEQEFSTGVPKLKWDARVRMQQVQ